MHHYYNDAAPIKTFSMPPSPQLMDKLRDELGNVPDGWVVS
jgi:hypothetical protein